MRQQTRLRRRAPRVPTSLWTGVREWRLFGVEVPAEDLGDGYNAVLNVSEPLHAAVAERLWSAMEVNNATAAASRLVKQRCRMLQRGVDVMPLGPGYCGPPEAY